MRWAREAGRGQTASQHQLLSAEVSCYHHDHDLAPETSRKNNNQGSIWHVQNVHPIDSVVVVALRRNVSCILKVNVNNHPVALCPV